MLPQEIIRRKRNHKCLTDEEIKGQSEKVLSILHDMENKFSKEQLEEIKSLLAESSVLYAIYNFKSIQDLNK